MLGKLKQLLQSGGSKGPKPSGLCLWHDLDGLNQLADELAASAENASEWTQVKEALGQQQPCS